MIYTVVCSCVQKLGCNVTYLIKYVHVYVHVGVFLELLVLLEN